MTTATGSNGWYPDPHARWPLRYWDGASWTDLVARIEDSSRLTTGVDIISRGQPAREAGAPVVSGETIDAREPAAPSVDEQVAAFG